MNFSKLEEKILEFWNKNEIFKKSLENPSFAKASEDKDFVFYDGPPFATGLPHYGHILASIIKDVIPRYQTMKGKRIPRKWGWDCHGLPIENLIEKDLNLKNKKDIEKYGVDKFNKKAQESVLRYADEWKKVIPRIGRWVDMEDDYKTMDKNYTESVWWVFKSLYDKGLIYEGYKPMHVCPRCETTLSNFEVTQNYKDIKDISVTVKFELVGEPETFILAWTTTPWTLPGNVALAVKEDIDYVKIKKKDEETGKIEKIVLAKGRLEDVFGGQDYKIIKEFKGKDLIGKKYNPLFNDYSKDKNLENLENGWKIYGASFVTTDEGTGIVHIAPAFGEEDMELGQKEKLPFVQHVGMDGIFKSDAHEGVEGEFKKNFEGMQVKPKGNPKETDEKIVSWLEKNNKLFYQELVTHSYPFCWRCDTPLLNYAASSWFVGVTEIKDNLIKNNEKIKWVPEHLKHGRFGKWLEGAHDWAISRSRYWGAPLPVWKCRKCDEIKVVGSVDEIREQLGGLNKIFLVRHGEAEHNIKRIGTCSPDADFPLTKRGKRMSKQNAKLLKEEKIDLIFASPVLRTQQTAKMISKELGIEVITDSRLREVGLGEFDNKPIEALREKYPTRQTRIENTEFGVESGDQIRKRLQNFIDEINEKYSNKNIVIVSHGDPLQIFYGITQGSKLLDSLEGWYPDTGFVKQTYSKPFDLHRPFIDEIEFSCSSTNSGQTCGEKMERVPEVFDCWFESGSMPYGQAHYPFENKKEFEKNFPAEFIAEGVDQTRGWFYTLLVLSTALFNETAFKNVVTNGIILAEGGQKMSKRLKNYPDPMYIVDKYGADSLRYYLLSSPAVRAESLNFSEKGVDEVSKKIVSKIINVQYFFNIYSQNYKNLEDYKSDNLLDKWILAKLEVLKKEVTENLDKYELDKAIRPIGEFVDDLSNWYIRRSRDRFKKDKNSVSVTKHVLTEFSKIIAPFMPFVADDVFKDLNPSKESVHLESWPSFVESSSQLRGKSEGQIREILENMEEVRRIVSLTLDLRLKAGIKVRQPLAELRIKNDESKIKNDEELLQLIKDEVNVKEVIFDKNIDEDLKLDTKITEELKKEGMFRELVRSVQNLRKRIGLDPEQKVILVIKTDKDGEKFIKKFESDIKKSTNLSSIKFESIVDGVYGVEISGLSFELLISDS